jgi:hypothetical protein
MSCNWTTRCGQCGACLQARPSTTWEQQPACTPDVWRLCGAQIPDANRIVACLRRNTPQLSDRCRAVFEKSDNAPHAVRIATTGNDVMIEMIGRGLSTGTTGPSLIMTTNKGIMLVARSRSRITRLGLIGLIPGGPTHDGTNDMRRAYRPEERPPARRVEAERTSRTLDLANLLRSRFALECGRHGC